jgi:molecular chaperone DnaK (HSP70)
VSEIDAVVRTGGSAQIPLFARMLERIFGPKKVVLTDVFGSVTAGLAIRAAQDL